MNSILKDIQEAVIKYANIISQVLQLEVEIVDENLLRIAGTGIYENKINEDISYEGYVYKTVIDSEKSQIIYSPGNEDICIPCPKKNICEEKFEMSTPIKLKGKVIGVIGLVCFTIQQKKHLMERFDVYMAFLQQISEFISITAFEKSEKNKSEKLVKLFNIVVDKIGQGVIVLDRHNKIIHINEIGMKELKLGKECIGKIAEIKVNGDNVFDKQEYNLLIDNEVFYLMGTICSIEVDENDYNRIFFFQEAKRFKAKLSDFASNKKVISCEDILGVSENIRILKENIKRIAVYNSTVLITGESGTGKEMVARAIHEESSRKNKSFIPINCAAIPDSLLESELFGYVKGAFTGADPMGKMGKFELANKGTIFLDEIGDMPLYLQTKLLRVLQERKIIRIGSNKPISIDVRVVAATNKNLAESIKENKFREDLYYRLNVIPIEIPPLRERKEDIELLIKSFIKKYLRLFNKNFLQIKFEDEVSRFLNNYYWPGNVRELENVVEFMINMVETDGIIRKNILPSSIREYRKINLERDDIIYNLKDLEKNEIKKALDILGYDTVGKKLAADKLGIGIATLYRKINEYNLSK